MLMILMRLLLLTAVINFGVTVKIMYDVNGNVSGST